MSRGSLAAFVSPHGFGHAARASAILAAAHRRSGARVHLFTSAPRWFFEESIAGVFDYHLLESDIGFRQKSALHIDLPGTIEALGEHLPFDEALLDRLAERVVEAKCRAVLCDISALGVAVARRAGVPSVLVENFRWAWLYEPLGEPGSALHDFGRSIDAWVDQADRHLQARPVCERVEGHEVIDPVSRERRLDRPRARAALGIEGEGPVVVVTMGGYGEDLPFLDRLAAMSETTFVVTGVPSSRRAGNLRLFDNNTPLFMPDVLRAADAVVAKLGYGTVSEVWREGLPLAGVTRPDFREMASLEAFAEDELSGFVVTSEDFREGTWIDRLPELLTCPRRPHPGGGAERAAEVLLEVAGID